jgi:hypothetical protein
LAFSKTVVQRSNINSTVNIACKFKCYISKSKLVLSECNDLYFIAIAFTLHEIKQCAVFLGGHPIVKGRWVGVGGVLILTRNWELELRRTQLKPWRRRSLAVTRPMSDHGAIAMFKRFVFKGGKAHERTYTTSCLP